MIVDSSALVAMALAEPERDLFAATLAGAQNALISAASYVETGIVLDNRRSPVLSRKLDDLLMDFRLRIEPLTASQALIARQAYRDFGRGSGHPAKLNFGDCLSYALAKERREPLLFKGNDFIHTDLEAAV